MPHATSSHEGQRRHRGVLAFVVLELFLLLACAGFVALGTWQVHRRAWKLDLIARVDRRVHAPAAPPPSTAWDGVTVVGEEYRHLRLAGRFLYDRQALVAASTELGSGYWAMTPLRLDDGAVVLINRGFVPPDWCGRDGRCARGPGGEVAVTGLLRLSETHAFLRHNDPTADRWYARDVQAIARARGLGRTAPFFVDQDAATGGDAGWPRGGLTVVSFPNNHLSYLITWYLLALMAAGAAVYLGYDEYRLRRGPA